MQRGFECDESEGQIKGEMGGECVGLGGSVGMGGWKGGGGVKLQGREERAEASGKGLGRGVGRVGGRVCGCVGGYVGAGPHPPLPGISAIAIAAGFAHTCAILTGGGVKCWGRNGKALAYGDVGSGALGIGSTTDQHSPVDVAGTDRGRGINPFYFGN